MKPYKCPKCPYKAIQQSKVNRHIRQVHKWDIDDVTSEDVKDLDIMDDDQEEQEIDLSLDQEVQDAHDQVDEHDVKEEFLLANQTI